MREREGGIHQCKACGSNLSNSGSPHRSVSKAYDRTYDQRHHPIHSRLLKLSLVGGDCILLAIQPILVYISKVDGNFLFSPISVNFLTEITKLTFAIIMLLIQHCKHRPGEKSLLSPHSIIQAARSNYLLAVPAFFYAINNYQKFIMQLYFSPATVKMLSNLKVLVIALLLKVVMKRKFTVMQWEALVLLLIGITVNQLQSTPTGASLIVPDATVAYLYTLIFVTVPSLASVYNEYALKSQFDTSIYLQNLFLYGYGAIFNLLAIFVSAIYKGGDDGFDLFKGHSKATMLLIINNAAQGILSSFFFKYADTILKKYSSTGATIFTGLAAAALFGHSITIHFVLGVSIVIISMHQFFSSFSEPKDGQQSDYKPLAPQINTGVKESTIMLSISNGLPEEASSHKISLKSEREPLLPV